MNISNNGYGLVGVNFQNLVRHNGWGEMWEESDLSRPPGGVHYIFRDSGN